MNHTDPNAKPVPMVDRSLARYSETRLIVDRTGEVLRMGLLMPGAENDLRIPTYLRRQLRQEKSNEHE